MSTRKGVPPPCYLVAGLIWIGTVIGSPGPEFYDEILTGETSTESEERSTSVGPEAVGAPGVLTFPNTELGSAGAQAPGWYDGPMGGPPGVGGPRGWNNGPMVGAEPGREAPGGGSNNGPMGGPPGVGGPRGWNNGPIGGLPGGPERWSNGPMGGPPGGPGGMIYGPMGLPDAGGPGRWNNGQIVLSATSSLSLGAGGLPGVRGPGGLNYGPMGCPVGRESSAGWNNGPMGCPVGRESSAGWNNGPMGCPVGRESSAGWNNGPMGGPPGAGGPGRWDGPMGGPPGTGLGGWNNGPMGAPPGVGVPVATHNGPTYYPSNINEPQPPVIKQDFAKGDQEKLMVGTSGLASAQEVHFALSLVPLLRAQPLPARLEMEASILRTFKPAVPPGFHGYKPFLPPGREQPDWRPSYSRID